MNETSGRRKVHKARQASAPVYSSTLPELSDQVDVLFRASNQHILNQHEAKWGDKIVTSQVIYKPAILASARTTLQGTRWNLHHESDITRIVAFPMKHQICQWDEDLKSNWSSQDARSDPEPSSFFAQTADYDFSPEHFDELKEEFLQHLIATQILKVEYNPVFKLDRKIAEPEDSFANRCMEKAREHFKSERHQLEDTLRRLSDRLKQRLEREVRDKKDPSEFSGSRHSTDFDIQEEIEAHDVKKTMADIRKEMEEVEQLRAVKLKEFEERLASVAGQRETETFRLNRGGVNIRQFRLIWLPYREYILQDDDARRAELVQAF